MARVTYFILVFIAFGFLAQCKSGSTKTATCTFKITNTTATKVTDGAVEIPLTEIEKYIKNFEVENLIVFQNNAEIASQVVFPKDKAPYLLALINLEPNASVKLEIKLRPNAYVSPTFPKRTYAELSIREGGVWEKVTKKNGTEQYEYKGGQFKNVEYLRVPEQHTDHSFYIRYEGPGWESDKVGYRFYLDWRNAVDIFGKRTPNMVLQKVGLDGFESYHDSCAWGQDVFKVGDALGLGSVAYWDGEKATRVDKTDSVDCKITLNGQLMSVIETNYFGWQMGENKADLNSQIAIRGGSRLSLQTLKISESENVLCTGIIKHEGIEAFNNLNDTTSQWVYLATYGFQSLANDSLGLGIVVNKKYVKELTHDTLNHIVVLQPFNGELSYYFLAAWEKESNGIKNNSQFKEYLNQLMVEFNNPLVIDFK